MNKEKIDKTAEKLKNVINCLWNRADYEAVLGLTEVAAHFFYLVNNCFVDDCLESLIMKVSKCISSVSKELQIEPDEKTVMIIDGFGISNRGLIHIYLKALGRYSNIVYVTYTECKDSVGEILSVVDSLGGKVKYIVGNTRIDKVKSLEELILDCNPSRIFAYILPWDVVTVTGLSTFKGLIKRYLINLTDHAFWLGKSSVDTCIDYRDYGATISVKYRKIPSSKVVKIPFYPIIDKTQPFLGFPFDVSPETRVVFSGGALYKTFGDDNKYYRIVEYILANYKEVIFWYAGEGNDSELKRLEKKYPSRIYHTQERPDLFQVMKHCFFFLNTYPICGGLMYQYAAAAGTIPLTLCQEKYNEGVLLNQENLEVDFDSYEALLSQIDTIMHNQGYVDSRIEALQNSVTKEEDFNDNIQRLLENNIEPGNFEPQMIETIIRKFQRISSDCFSVWEFYSMLAHKNIMKISLRFYPVQFVLGLLYNKMKKVRLWK